MLVATKTSIYYIPSDGSKEPLLLFRDNEIRRVAEGLDRNIVTLSNGKILVLKDNEQLEIGQVIPDRIDSLCIIEENPLNILIGCTPPNLYRLREGEEEAKLNPSFEELEVRGDWFTPWGGPPAVRSLARTSDGWVYADIHVGSIMRSQDNGETWEPVGPSLHRDVHEVVISQTDPSKVYANTYLSVYVSNDRGENWSHRSDSLNKRYGRGIAVHPEDPNMLLCGVSDGPSGSNVHGQLYRTENAGETWSNVETGFPKYTRKNIDTFHIAFESQAAWVTDEETLYRSIDEGKTWETFWKAPEEITMISLNQRNEVQ